MAKPFLLTFDVEEFDLPLEHGRALSSAGQLRATTRGLARILPLLERHRVRATFFVTAEFARQRPRCVRALADAHHEIAVHGFAHADDYAGMPAASAIARLRQARLIVTDISGRPARGIRTPRLQPCPRHIFAAAGFAYDASPHPAWVPGRYNGLRLPRRPWWDSGVLCVPISVLPGIRYPVSWVWYRLAGSAGGIAIRLASIGAPYLHVYFHPWEAMDLRRFGVPAWLRVRTGTAFLAGLDRLLGWAERATIPMTVDELATAIAQRGTAASAGSRDGAQNLSGPPP